MNHIERLQKIRTKLNLTDSPKFVFFANLLQVPDVFDDTIETAATDGSSIRWNPAFVDSINDAQLLGTMLHELMHIGLLHNLVAAQYDDHKRLNIAADLAVNSILAEMQVKLPDGALMPGKGEFAHLPTMLSMEEYYHQIGDMDDEDLPNEQPGAVEPAGSEAKKHAEPNQPALSKDMAGEIIRAMVNGAMERTEQALERSDKSMPSALSKAIKAALTVKVDWAYVLKKYRTKLMRGGSDWTRPNRRVAASGYSIARNRTRKVNNVIVLWDCSGSMSVAQSQELLAEIIAVFGEVAGTVHLWQHDTKIVHRDELAHGKELPPIERRTFGGTSHVQPFEELNESGIEAELVICMTDCETAYPEEFGNRDVLWISNVRVSERNVPPVGELLVI